jgi:hypothetical protein
MAGAIYCLRLWWPSITSRFNWLIAPLCVVAFWPAILWAEVEHAVREKLRRKAIQIASKEYLSTVATLSAGRADLAQGRVADLDAERRRRACQ